jgi:hypothetical protein
LAEGVEHGAGRSSALWGTLSKPVITGTATDPPGPMRISSTAVSIGDPKGAVRISAVSPMTMDTWPGTAGAEGPNRFRSRPLITLPATLNRAAGRNTSLACSALVRRGVDGDQIWNDRTRARESHGRCSG